MIYLLFLPFYGEKAADAVLPSADYANGLNLPPLSTHNALQPLAGPPLFPGDLSPSADGVKTHVERINDVYCHFFVLIFDGASMKVSHSKAFKNRVKIYSW